MHASPPITIEHLRELARRHGVALDEARAADLLPRAESLIARLAAMAERLAPADVPAPGPVTEERA